MNTSFFRQVALTSAAISSAFALSAFAGPGPQYWDNFGKATNTATPAAAAPRSVCPGSTVVPVPVRKPAWANGKGPLVETRIGTKRVCTVCPVTTSTTAKATNGRGPSTVVETIVPGAPHDCTSGCPAAKS